MGRKNVYEPHTLQKLLKTHHLQEEITWYFELPTTQRTTLLQFSEALDDLPEQLKNMEINFWNHYDDFQIIGEVKVSASSRLYLISDHEYRSLYLALEKTWPSFWYPVNHRKELGDQIDHLLSLYQAQLPHSCHQHLFLGIQNPHQNLSRFRTWLQQHSWTDQLVYGSSWKDYPFRGEQADPLNILQHQALRQTQKEASYSCRTRLSNSEISFHSHQGILTLELNYPESVTPQIQHLNQHLNTQYPLDLPIDALLVIVHLVPQTLIQLIQKTPFQETNLLIAFLLANTESQRYQMLDELIKIEHQPEIEFTPETQTLINTLKQRLKKQMKSPVIVNPLDQIIQDWVTLKKNPPQNQLSQLLTQHLQLLALNQQSEKAPILLSGDLELPE